MSAHMPDYEAALAALLKAKDWSATRAAIEKYPELLEDVVLQTMSRTLAKSEGSARVRLQRLISLLMEVRAIGVDAALVEAEQEENLQEAVLEWIGADSISEIKAAIEQYPVLLSDEAAQELRKLADGRNEYALDRTEIWIQLLHACRNGDIDTALTQYAHNLADVDRADKLAGEWLSTETEEQRSALLREHPVLLLNQAKKFLEKFEELRDRADAPTDPESKAFFEKVRVRSQELKGIREGR